jgi:CBS domain-containing protein
MALRLSYTRATVIAAGIGKGFAALFAVAGLFLNPILLLIALFVWLGARQEGLLARLRASMSGANVTNAMYTHFETLAASESVGSAAARMIRSPQQDYPVLDGERLIGVLGQREAVELLARGRRDVRLAQVVAGNVSAARPTDDLETVGLRVLAGRNAAVAVVDGIQVIGMVTRESLGEFLALREAHARTPTAA